MNNEIFKSKNITVDFLGFYKYSELYLNFNLMIDNQYIRSIYVTLDDFRVNGKTISFKTKGDYNNTKDSWTVKQEDVIGIVKFRIRWVGMPTVALNELLNK